MPGEFSTGGPYKRAVLNGEAACTEGWCKTESVGWPVAFCFINVPGVSRLLFWSAESVVEKPLKNALDHPYIIRF